MIKPFTCPFRDGQIVLTSDKRFGRVWLSMAVTYNDWLVQIQLNDGTIEQYHSDLLAVPPKPRLVCEAK